MWFRVTSECYRSIKWTKQCYNWKRQKRQWRAFLFLVKKWHVEFRWLKVASAFHCSRVWLETKINNNLGRTSVESQCFLVSMHWLVKVTGKINKLLCSKLNLGILKVSSAKSLVNWWSPLLWSTSVAVTRVTSEKWVDGKSGCFLL